MTDEETERYYRLVGRPNDYHEVRPGTVAYYDGCVYVDLSKIECTIALPMHPSNIYTIRELKENAADILHDVPADPGQ